MEKQLEKQFLFFEMAMGGLMEGRPFDGMAFGTFTDMLGREVKLNEADQADFVTNTQAAIEATRTEGGELVGLPIDSLNHDKAAAAGWIVGVELAGDIIRLIPKWTRVGIDLISEGLMRFFSPTVNIEDRVILGGSLTNWPATTDKTGKVLLRPIELSQGVNGYTLTDMETGVVNRVRDMLEDFYKRIAGNAPADPNTNGEETMNFDELTDEQRDTFLGQAREQVRSELATATGQADAGLDVVELMAELKASALAEVAELVAKENTARKIADFSVQVTAGTPDNPRGLPLTTEEMETFLGGLTDEQRAAAFNIFERTVENGLTDYGELGHGKQLAGVTELAAEFKPMLKAWLDEGLPIARWFADNPEMGAMADYDLSEYEEAA